MLSELQTRKLTHLFKIYDHDADGYLRQSDYDTHAHRLAQVFGWSETSEVEKQLHEHFGKEWAQLEQFADFDHDHAVGLDEWLGFYGQIVASPEMMEATIKAYMEGFYELWDIVDPDNSHLGHVMTIERFRGFFEANSASQEAADAAFARLDRNHDGIMESDDIFQASVEFFGDDPDAAGNELFGPY